MPSKTKLNLLSNSKFKSTSPDDSNWNFNFSDDVVLREEEKSAIIAKPGWIWKVVKPNKITEKVLWNVKS